MINRKRSYYNWFGAILGISATSVLFFAWNDGVESFKMCITTILVLLGIGASVIAYRKDKPKIGNLTGICSFLVAIVPILGNESPPNYYTVEKCRPFYFRVDSIWNDYEVKNREEIESIRQDIKDDFWKTRLNLIKRKAIPTQKYETLIKHLEAAVEVLKKLDKRNEVFLKVLFVEPTKIYLECYITYQQMEPFFEEKHIKALKNKIKTVNNNTNALLIFEKKPQPSTLPDRIEYQMERDNLYMKWHDGCLDFVKTLGKILGENSKRNKSAK